MTHKISTLKQKFIDSFSPTVSKKKLLPFQEYRVKHKKNGHNDLILELIHYKQIINDDKKIVIEHILDDCRKIYESLLPLHKVGIYFSLSLAGGAVRDLLLNKHFCIKDLDIVISINNSTLPSHVDLYNILGFNAFDFPWFASQKKYSYKTNSSFMDNKDRLFEIIKFILSKEHTFEACFSPRKDKVAINTDNKDEPLKQIDQLQNTDYLNKHLQGVIKINTSSLHYPVDILITSLPVNNFIQYFDLNICKACFNLVHDKNSKIKIFDFPESIKDFLFTFIPTYYFLNDIKNKTISLNADDKSSHDIKNSIDSHLPRIISKYPNYKVVFNLLDSSDPSFSEKSSIINHYELNNKLSIKNEETTKRTKI